jgi:hypothetical protein
VFSEEELGQLRGFPEITRAELIRYFTLTPADEMFVRTFRGSGNVLGAAVQLCTLPWLGFVPDEVSSVPRAAVDRLGERLRVVPEVLAGYAVRDQTRTDHLREIAQYSRWRAMDELEWKQLGEFLFSRAMEHDAPKLLFRLACEYLISVRVIRPGVVNLLERVATARDRARAETWTRVEHLLDSRRRARVETAGVAGDQARGRRDCSRPHVIPSRPCTVGVPDMDPGDNRDGTESLAWMVDHHWGQELTDPDEE